MRRTVAVILLVTAAIAAVYFFTSRSGGGPVHAVKIPQAGPAPRILAVANSSETSPKAQSHSRKLSEKEKRIRIGSFERPKNVPRYRILQKTTKEQRGVRVIHMLVDTRAGSQHAYVLITRDIKARYANYDAIGIEFTNSAGSFGYEGGALIFNTPAGSRYIGYVYAPPNDLGYVVAKAD